MKDWFAGKGTDEGLKEAPPGIDAPLASEI